MALLSPSFILGLIVLFYLLSFVLFAVIRIATGVSIQRIGYLCLRRISYTPRDGTRIDIRGLSLHLHRPTFARPTWVSLRLTELKVTLDFQTSRVETVDRDAEQRATNEPAQGQEYSPAPLETPTERLESRPGTLRGQTWRNLTRTKERIKALHEKINWLRMIDLEVLSSSCEVSGVGSFQIASFTVAVDTRRKTVDRGRLFRHKKIPERGQQPAEWMLVLKSILFTAEGKESLEILDICSLNVHGLLYKGLAGLRDVSVSLKLGRIHVPYDDLMGCLSTIENQRKAHRPRDEKKISFSDMIKEFDMPGSREERIVQAVSDSKEFISSILRGIQEIQLAISFIGLSKKVKGVRPAGRSLFLNFAMNEFGIDLFRLDPKSPAHRMYFSPQDIAHQALLAAISIGVSMDDGDGKPERLLYIPMATTTVKTTLPSKTIADSTDKNAAERNANMLFANLVVTSPSLDLDLKHMAIVLALLKNRTGDPASDRGSGQNRLISRLLPKASIRISVQEPVARVVLPISDPGPKTADQYDLLISSISSISLDLESSHSSVGELHYALTSSLRISSHRFYYQAYDGERHNLLLIDALELKIQVSATPEVSVVAFGNLETLSVHMIRPEISQGVQQIFQQLRKISSPDSSTFASYTNRASFLRRMPPWLVHAQIRGSNFGFEVAGVDTGISQNIRGVALQLESWNAEYRIQKSVGYTKRQNLRRHMNNSTSGDESFRNTELPVISKPSSETMDGRRMVFHILGFETFVVEGVNHWEPEPFISIPKFETTMSTTSDQRGFIFNISTHAKALHINYSLYRYYAIGVAQGVLRRAFGLRSAGQAESRTSYNKSGAQMAPPLVTDNPVEITTIDVKVALFQVKATMPSDPPMMLQLYGMEAGHHRWAAPFLKLRMLRLYAEPPKIKSAWARILSVNNARMDLREGRKKNGDHFTSERSVDLFAEFTRLAIPHQLVIHKIFDNFVNAFKATEQLNHRFNTGTDTYILKKRPEEPKKVPRVSFRTRALMFELEDGLFDWKLGLIYRVGLNEQKQRLAREDAFRLKVKKLQEQDQRRNSSKYKSRFDSRQGRDRSNNFNHSTRRSSSPSRESHTRQRSSSPSNSRSRYIRYDAEAVSGLTGTARISAQDAWLKLQEHNAASWKKRIAYAIKYQSNAMKEIRNLFWGNDEPPEYADDSETVISIPGRPGLMSALVNDLHLIIDSPSFPVNEYPKFLHSVGKGMPYNMEYSLIIPLNLQVNLGEAKVTMRNYPLPLIHVPALKAGQSSRLPSLSLRTDFVIAEEFRDDQSLKHVRVEVVPRQKITDPPEVKNGFCIDVRRTVSPVKTYSDVDIVINTSNPTIITWGTSYQPAIQDMMQIIESFTKPQIDPSDRAGFWDKIRLIFHSRIRFTWKGDGDVHLRLKGSRDPYVVTGHGAGFVMCFRSNVQWDIHQDDDPKKFMTVTCGEYVLAVPDYSHQARQTSRGSGHDSESVSSSRSSLQSAIFKKVIMKLSGNVRWLAGLVFERDRDEGGRSFEFIPHHDVILKIPKYAKATNGLVYDAFRGFRSHHIHLSLAVIAPVDRDWSVTNLKPSPSYNSMHLSPRFFTHFFDWWSLFSGVMALPVRQGRLFPGVEKSTKKFGRHLATIKYNLLLSPLIIAHIYKHKDAEDYSSDSVVATGLKLRIDSFMLDLHQRREEFVTQSKGRLKNTTTTGMRINKAQLDFISADIRAVSANIAGTSLGKIKHATDADVASFHDQAYTTPDISRFTIPDNDLIWIDMDDFVELDWILPVETHPETKIMPLAFSPRFTYFRQTDHNGNVSGDSGRTSHFGDEPTHFCIMSQDNDPQRVQHDLIQQRVAALKEERDAHKHTLGEQELKVVRDGARDPSIREHHDLLAQQYRMIEDKLRFMQYMLKNLSEKLNIPSDGDDCSHPTYGLHDSDRLSDLSDNADMDNDDATSSTEFNNRFTVHNIQLKWNNPLRNIILRYVHQVSQRRGFVYYMSRRAVKFILDIVEEQNRSKGNMNHAPQQYTPTTQPSPSVSFKDDPSDINLEERIKDILKDGKSFVDANDPHKPENPSRQASGKMEQGIAEEFTAQNNYHVRLIAPQIQLQSAKNAKSVLLVTAKAMQLKVIQIMDKTRLADDVSGLVQRRFSVDMDGVQSFVTNQRTLNNYLHLYSANRYGSPKNSAWPPWVPLEVNFDFQLNPFGWFRVIQKTSASLRYDKYNTLRLKYNDEVSKGELDESNAPDDTETRIDHLWVEFPHIRAMCDSSQYYAMYVIVLDLLLYSEPLEKIRNERLEKIMLAADFSDLTGAPEMVVSLQERIRQLEEIKGHFQLHARYLDRQGWLDRLAIEKDLVNCENELFFMMKAITTSQRKYDDRGQNTQSNGLLRWYLSASEIVWHLMRENNEPLMEIQLKHAAYDRTDNSDGSNHNTMEIERIHGLNLLPDALYPEMIAPFFENGPRTENRNGDSIKMFKVQWYMLEAIAGIPVLDQFEVNLFPLKIQLEREVGKKLFEYIFPGNAESVNASPFLVKHMPPMDDGPDDSDSELNAPITPSSLTSDSGETGASTRSGSLELRLRPTLTLSDLTSRPSTSSSSKPRTTGGGSISRESHRFKLFQNQHRSLSAPRSRTATAMPLPKNPSRRKSGESLRGSGVVETPVSTSSTNLERTKRFGIHRTSSKDSGAEKEKASDDLTEMMSRASNYMTLAYVKIPSVVLCLSYKGKGERNLEDVHDFVFRMPTLEYRNKTWSNLDLALRLKKDVIKALISHTGAIIGNKFSHHRPSKTQQSRLREIANSSSLLRNTRSLSSSLSRTSTPRHRSSSRERSGQALNSTFIAGWGSLNRTFSDASSFDSMISPKNKGPGVSVDAQTPNTHDLSPPSTETGLANRSDTDSFVGSDLETEEPLEIDSNQFLAPSRSGTDVDNTRAR